MGNLKLYTFVNTFSTKFKTNPTKQYDDNIITLKIAYL